MGMKLLKNCDHWDARFFLLCDMVASWSEDTSRKVGSIIVGPQNEIRATGYNGFPRGVDARQPERHDRDSGTKYFWFEHAERNAIYNAAGSGIATLGCRIYVNSFPCADCARAIVQCGIKQVNTFQFNPRDEKFSRHFAISQEIFSETEIDVRLFSRNDEAIFNQNKAFTVTRDPRSNLLR